MTTCLQTSIRRCFAASPIDTARSQGNQRLETRRVGAAKRGFRARPPPILTLSTRYQTSWNATKCHACGNLLGNHQKEKFCSFPHRRVEATGKPETRDETRGSIKTNISRETSANFHSRKHATRRGFAASPHRHGEATGKLETPDETRGSTKTSISCETSPASKSTFSDEFSLEPENLLPQNRCFVRGFRQFSAHRTKCHACHGICTLSPRDAALPMRFTKNTQHDTSKVLRLPRKMTMDTSKVLRLPRKMQHIF